VKLTRNQLAPESAQIGLFLASVVKSVWRTYAGTVPIKKGSMKAHNALQDMISSIRGLGDIWMHSEESQNENRDNPLSLEVPKLYERGADGSLVPTISFSHRPQRSCWQPRQRES
jgi:hypothetical protein